MQINDFFERSLAVDPNVITIIVCVLCVLLLYGCFLSKKERAQRWREIAPTLMVSIGILGTFWGTFIALSEFQTIGPENKLDHEAMVESIPAVLAGMKTAFVTTLIGLFFAFFTRVSARPFPEAEQKPLPIETETKELLQQIKDGIVGENDKSLSSQINALRSEHRDSATDLKSAIAGDGDSSLYSQLTKLRNENNVGFNKMDSHLDGLAETIRHSLVENMTKLVNELREVIVNQLTEQLKITNELLRKQLGEMLERIEEALIKQFGETFKQFNEATQAIKKWQEDHRVQVEQLTEAFSATAVGIEKIRADCESIPDTMEQLKNLMGELDERLKAFADMKKSAEESFPIIKKHLDAIGADLQASAAGFSGLQETIQATHKQAGDLAQQHIETARQHIEQVGGQINQTAEQVQAVANRMMESSEAASKQHLQTIQAMTESVQNETEKMISANKEASDQHQKNLADIVAETQNTLTNMTQQYAQTMQSMSQSIQNEAEKVISATRDASEQHRQELASIVNAVQTESQRCVSDMQNTLTEITNQHERTINAMTESVKTEAAKMISETHDASNQYRQDLVSIVNAVQTESQRCVSETREQLTTMANQHAQIIAEEVAKITQRWGEHVVGIAEKMVETMPDARH